MRVTGALLSHSGACSFTRMPPGSERGHTAVGTPTENLVPEQRRTSGLGLPSTFSDRKAAGFEVDSREATMALKNCLLTVLVAGGLYLAHKGPVESNCFFHQLQQFLEFLIVVLKPIAEDDGADDV